MLSGDLIDYVTYCFIISNLSLYKSLGEIGKCWRRRWVVFITLLDTPITMFWVQQLFGAFTTRSDFRLIRSPSVLRDINVVHFHRLLSLRCQQCAKFSDVYTCSVNDSLWWTWGTECDSSFM